MDYKALVEVYKDLESTTKRLEKTEILAKFIKTLTKEELEYAPLLVQGKVFPPWDERKIGFSQQLMIRAIAKTTGSEKQDVIKEFRKSGDLGKVAETLIGKKTQQTLFTKKLTTEKVFSNIQKLASLEGEGTVGRKIALVAELLSSAKPEEARFIVNTVLETLRIGIAEGILRDAIARAFDKEVKEVEQAFDSTADFSEVALLAKSNKLDTVKLKSGRPIKVMLAILVKNVEEAYKALGKPAQFEYKLDGFRLQIHKTKEGIKLFTRRLEDVTKQFPEIVEYVKDSVKGESFILDSEAVGIDKKTKKYLPFQAISQRIKRKYNIEEMAKKFPIELNIFDIISYDKKDLLNQSQKQRRNILEKIVKEKKGKIVLTKKLVTKNTEKAEEFYSEAIANGAEGLMIKKLDANYKSGRYVGGWVKLKPTLEPLDVVIIGAEYGTGKRAGYLSSYHIACKKGNKFLECGKVASGIKEKETEEGMTMQSMTKLLKPLITEKKGKTVKIKPEVVIEVIYEEIQKSPTYSSGYALRFPRLKRLRTKEKSANDINTLEDIEHIFKVQRSRK